MILIADLSWHSINRRLSAYNLFNGINLEVKSLLKEDFDMYYFNYTENPIVHSSYIFNPNFEELKYNEEISQLIYGIAISLIGDIISEGEEITIIADKDWYKYHEKFVKALIDVYPNDIYTLGYGENIDAEYIKNHFYQILDIESITLNYDYIESLNT